MERNFKRTLMLCGLLQALHSVCFERGLVEDPVWLFGLFPAGFIGIRVGIVVLLIAVLGMAGLYFALVPLVLLLCSLSVRNSEHDDVFVSSQNGS